MAVNREFEEDEEDKRREEDEKVERERALREEVGKEIWNVSEREGEMRD